ncbi:hypothetical protein C9374_009664 [Naegleria lovaniensis]|uniref:Uncharacterized protein n=1 Tax=Naegleria lovaniensis TaxID=51637 RepID=A0AA88H5C1_NAELO|nr:uncharacterized protein C9374_009664 [Naegleria lovaniensis]KAG2393087.1 hypothetical protein C9374_009664 [Naegleria lovaniensis]
MYEQQHLYLLGDLKSVNWHVFPSNRVINLLDSNAPSNYDSDAETFHKITGDSAYQIKIPLPLGITIRKVISGRHHTHIITEEGRVLSFGSNAHGELCIGKIGPLSIGHDSCVKGLVQARGKINQFRVVDGAGGGYHSIFLTSDHRVFAVGLNSSHQCGLNPSAAKTMTHRSSEDHNDDTTSSTTMDELFGEEEEEARNTCITTPREIPPEHFDHHQVVRVGASNSHSVFLTKSHLVYVAGSNSNGSCGGVVTTDRPLLLKFPFGFDPIEVSCGYDDTTILSAQGRAFGCGCSSLGSVYCDTVHGAYTLKSLYGGKNNVARISSGYFCEAYLTSDGALRNASGSIEIHVSKKNHAPTMADSSLQTFIAGDYALYITNEYNEKRKTFGKICKLSDSTDITGIFSIEDLSLSVGAASQRNCFIIYQYRDEDSFWNVSKHFIFLNKLLAHERKPLSDIEIFVEDIVY